METQPARPCFAQPLQRSLWRPGLRCALRNWPMGVRRGGESHPLDFENFSKNVVFLVSSGKIKFNHFCPPRKILEKSISGPPLQKFFRCPWTGRTQYPLVGVRLSICIRDRVNKSYHVSACRWGQENIRFENVSSIWGVHFEIQASEVECLQRTLMAMVRGPSALQYRRTDIVHTVQILIFDLMVTCRLYHMRETNHPDLMEALQIRCPISSSKLLKELATDRTLDIMLTTSSCETLIGT